MSNEQWEALQNLSATKTTKPSLEDRILSIITLISITALSLTYLTISIIIWSSK